ncbi:MAG TPA: RNA polymerase sigma factor [Myxococcota bacterium]|nr:RNA polymerase sigma factor [Myxococcota bacterium]
MADLELPDALRDELAAAWHRYLDHVQPIRPGLHVYCRRLTGNLWDAEDLVQETLLRGFGTLGRIRDPIRNPRAYLLRAATHLWIDGLRKLAREGAARAAAEVGAEGAEPAGPSGELRDAGRRLLQRLAPQERAAVLLKDVFDLDLEESAEVLETTVGAVKAALHRGRQRLKEAEREPTLASHRPAPSIALVDRFVELFNAGDRSGLLALMLDNASTENVGGGGFHWGREGHRSKWSWFEGALGGHPEWPAWFQFESQRTERAIFHGEPIVLHFHTRRGKEALDVVVRLEEQDGRVARLRSYGFCPEVVREVGSELGLPVLTGLHRAPTPAPGRYFGEPARRSTRDGDRR